MTWDEVESEIERFRGLRDGWDGEGTQAPTAGMIGHAAWYADSHRHREPPPDRVHVSVNGTVVFEWHDDHEYCELEFKSALGLQRTTTPIGDMP